MCESCHARVSSPHVLLLPSHFSLFFLRKEHGTRRGEGTPGSVTRSLVSLSELLILTRNLTFMVLARCARRSMSRVSERGVFLIIRECRRSDRRGALIDRRASPAAPPWKTRHLEPDVARHVASANRFVRPVCSVGRNGL